MSVHRSDAGTRRRRHALASLLVLLLGAPGGRSTEARAEQQVRPPLAATLAIAGGERLLVVAPHPDDESIGAAGLVQRVLARGGTVDVVLVTAGDGYPEGVRGMLDGASPVAQDYVAYGATRIGEARDALTALATQASAPDRVRLSALGFPDGALASLRATNVSSDAPARSPTTGATDPPYDALVAAPDAPYAGDVLRRELAAVVAAARPTIVALPDPLDTHPDHATTGLFALEALAEWRKTVADPNATPATVPRVLAYLVHWPDWPPGWDATTIDPAAEHTPLALPDALPRRSGRVALALTESEITTKRDALARHVTQQRQMPVYLAAFVRGSEPFTLLSPPP